MQVDQRKHPAGRARRMVFAVVAISAVLAGATSATAAVGRHRVAGPRGDGTSVTPYGWTVTPAGRQVTLGDKPFGTAKSPDGKTILVSNDGQYRQSLMVLDAATGDVRQSISYASPEAMFVGVAYSPDGQHVYASAGGNNKLRVYGVQADRTLVEGTPILLPTTNPAGVKVNHFPAGIAVSADGRTVWTANSLSDSVSIIDVATRTVRIAPVGANPYAVALSPGGHRAYVSNWGAASVSVLDTATGATEGLIKVGEHPSALLINRKRGELYVADTDSDQLSVIDLRRRAVSRTVELPPYRHAPVGSNPNALALAPDGGTLYVADAGADDVDVIRLARTNSDRGRSHDVIVGRIPTGWYPTGVDVSRDGRTIYVANAKGLGAGPNPNGPNPYTDALRRPSDEFAAQYVGSMIKGTMSIIRTPDADTLERDTAQVARNNHYPDGADPADTRVQRADSVVPRHPGDPSPIKHVIYVVKENRTYDQVLGSLGRGNGDPALNLFDDASAPNIRGLAHTFVTLDNFYAAAEVSADGWNWSTAATQHLHAEDVGGPTTPTTAAGTTPTSTRAAPTPPHPGKRRTPPTCGMPSTTPACPTATSDSGDSAPARSPPPRRTWPPTPNRPTPATTSPSPTSPAWTPTPRPSTNSRRPAPCRQCSSCDYRRITPAAPHRGRPPRRP